MEIILLIICIMVVIGLALIMTGLENEIYGLAITGLIIVLITAMSVLCLIFGIVTIISWIAILLGIHFLTFAVSYKIQRLVDEDEIDKKEMIMFAAIPIVNIVITFGCLWTIIDHKYHVKQKIKDGYFYTIKKSYTIAKKTLDGILELIDKCPPNIKK